MDACFGGAREDDALFMEIEWRLLRLISEGEDEDEDGGGTFDSRNPFHTAARKQMHPPSMASPPTVTKFEYHGNHHHQHSVVARSRSATRPINGTGVFIPAASLMGPITTIVDGNQKKPPRRRRGAPRGVGNQKLS